MGNLPRNNREIERKFLVRQLPENLNRSRRYLIAHGVDPKDFNSYGARRGNHEVMMRGTFANIRLRNQLAPGTEGGWTTHQPDATVMTRVVGPTEVCSSRCAMLCRARSIARVFSSA